ncbi:MAG: DUF4139 domain-containing protein [Kiritimatiellae bacterium]|nr:DUF4139 domain-containing protein [Kiritimatiellia bacterium]
MKRIAMIFLVPLVAVSADLVKQSELDPAPVVSVGLYKNGLAVVTRQITPDKKGVSRVDGACRPAYGTFWHSADKPVTVTSSKADLLRDTDGQSVLSSWTDTYAGREASVTFRAAPTLSATIAAAEKNGGVRLKTFSIGEKDDLFTLNGTVSAIHDARKPPETPVRRYYAYQEPIQQAPSTDLSLRLATGSLVVIPDVNVVAVAAKDGVACGIERQASVLKFEGAMKPYAVQYLTQGAAWTPAYRLDLKDDRGTVTMTADLRNEIMDWDEAEVSLISGFPNLLYAGVQSLLGWDMSFNRYRDAVNAAENADPWAIGGARMRSGVMAQSVMMNSAAADGFEVSPAAFAVNESGAGSDIHYRSIGKVTLKKGETRSVPLGAGESEIKRIVDWDVGDSRDEYGRNRKNDNEQGVAILWDAVRFTNPFSFPMTTAPIEVTEAGRILGQAKSTWTNPGDTTLVKITKALSVKGSYSETGDGKTISSKISSLKADERFNYQSRDYRKEVVSGTFIVQNFRKVPASLIVKKTISGEIVETSIAPTKNRALPAQDWRVNLERALTWEFELQPGEKREFTLTYWLWVLI